MPTAIHLKLDTSRDDKGKTPNYHVYTAVEQFTAKNGKGQDVNKNVIMGGNGTIYIANPVAAGIETWVLIPKALLDQLTFTGHPGDQRQPTGGDNASAPPPDKPKASRTKKR